MPTIVPFNDIEKTFELKTFELTLSCGKCPKGQLIASEKPAEPGHIIHVCTDCQREQAIEGVSYPYTTVRKFQVATRNIERQEVIPDKEPDDYNQADINKLSMPELITRLKATRNPEQVDFIEVGTDFQLRQQVDLCRTLYDMAREAAELRAEMAPVEKRGIQLTPVNILMMNAEAVADVLTTTRFSTDIDLIQANQVLKMLLFSAPFRKALYTSAREVVASRNKDAKPQSGKPTKGSGAKAKVEMV
ncbi:hypothetical protein [Spirosoma foliorum]|uniref:Uncharacterized protein n=1 Tax=Spirosoma foliorum TaxID=2710596 RepID=A0A7G5GTV2_9BACT|nr:hypothetical protein [Spirosoma foliorum]QMW02294.1 hypothetical protein H3H32_30955 [Spirosoma foliorum]